MKKLLVTNEFCSGAKKLVKDKRKDVVSSLRTVLILLANGRPIPRKYRDHNLTDKDYRELHVSGDVLLLYKNETDSDTLVISLKLTNITNHKNLDRDSSKKRKYEYHEVSTQDLHDITSSIKRLTAFDEMMLNDLLESISDYASENLSTGYILLSDFHVRSRQIYCNYDYYTFGSNTPSDSIEFVIDTSDYKCNYIQDLNRYVYTFADQISAEFENRS